MKPNIAADQIGLLWSEASSIEDKDEFISEFALSSIWKRNTGEIPESRIEALGQLWDRVRWSPKDMADATETSVSALCRRFCISRSAAMRWDSPEDSDSHREIPPHVRMMMLELLGLLPFDVR